MGETTQAHERRHSGSTLWTGIAGRCPSCHRGKLFAGYLTLAPKCNVCGLDYSFADAGDGPAVFVILVTGFVVTGLALFTEIALRAALLAARGDMGPARHHPAARSASVLQGRAHRACNSGTRPKRASSSPNKAASMRTKSLAGLTALMLAAFALLIGLGVWQLQRLHWKEGLIAEIETRTKGEPIGLSQATALVREGKDPSYYRVKRRGPLRPRQGALSLRRVRGQGGVACHHAAHDRTGRGRADRSRFRARGAERSILPRSRRAWRRGCRHRHRAGPGNPSYLHAGQRGRGQSLVLARLARHGARHWRRRGRALLSRGREKRRAGRLARGRPDQGRAPQQPSAIRHHLVPHGRRPPHCLRRLRALGVPIQDSARHT